MIGDQEEPPGEAQTASLHGLERATQQLQNIQGVPPLGREEAEPIHHLG